MRMSSGFGLSLLMILFATAGCVQLPQTTSGMPTVTEMPACGVSVRFSGNSEKLSADQIKKFLTPLGEYAKWEATGWKFSTHRLLELALCSCRDYPLTANDAEDHPDAKPMRAYSIAGIGQAYEEADVVNSSQEKVRTKIVRLESAPNCALTQIVISPDLGNAAGTFFPTLSLISKASAPITSSQAPSNSIAVRLRQLDQLLKDRLITQEEYSKRRNVILESL